MRITLHKFSFVRNLLLLLIFNFQFSIFNCFAQESKTFLQSFIEKMSAQPVSFDFTFTYENLAKDTKETRTGTALCNDRKFRILTGEMDVYCDGHTKWLYNVAAEEVMVFPASETHDITDNPLQYIRQNAGTFKYKREVQRLSVNGQQLLHLDMFPQDKKAVYISVGLTVEAGTYIPVKILYKLKDGQRYTIDIANFDDRVGAKNPDFVFPVAQYPSVEIVDLR